MSAPLISDGVNDTSAVELAAALAAVNKLQRTGNVSRKQIDSYLLDKYGLTKAALTQAVKAMPKEVAPKPVTTGILLKAQAYGATGGWLDEIQGLIGAIKGTGYAKARDAARKEMAEFEKNYPGLARGMKAYGLGASMIAAPLAARGALALNAGRGISAATLVGSDAPLLGAGGRAALGAAEGAAVGAGGMFTGEPTGIDRLPGAAIGAAGGALTSPFGVVQGAAGAAANPAIRKMLPWIGGGVAAGASKKLLDYLTTPGS